MSVQYQNRLQVDARNASVDGDVTARCREFGQQLIEEHPLATTLGVFGLGLSIGTMIGGLLASERHSHSGQAEVLGHRVLGAVKDILPDNFRSYLS